MKTLNMFSAVYFKKKNRDYLLSLCSLNEPESLITYYIDRKIITKKKINLSSFRGMSRACLGISLYSECDKSDLPFNDVKYEVVRELYFQYFKLCSLAAPSYIFSRTRTKFDQLLVQNRKKKTITDYIFFLRFFPYFNYFMIKSRQEYTNFDETFIYEEEIDIRLQDTKDILTDYLINENLFLYLENIKNIMLGNLNIFNYYIKFYHNNLSKGDKDKIIKSQALFEIYGIIDDFFIDPIGELEGVDFKENNYNSEQHLFRWLLKKFLLVKLKDDLGEEDDEDYDEIKDLKKKYSLLKREIESIENYIGYRVFDHNEEQTRTNHTFKNIKSSVQSVVEILRFMYMLKNRNDNNLLYTLFFSSGDVKILFNTGEGGFIFNKIKHFECEKNIDIYLS